MERTLDSSSGFRLFVMFALLTLMVPVAWSAPPPGFQSESVITGLVEPTALAFTPDGRMLILERGGTIRVVLPGALEPEGPPFLQLTNLSTNGEGGLVGIALDPAFAANGHYFVFYTANAPLRDRVSRFTASGNTTVPGSEVVIWQDVDLAAIYHHGGTVAFGPAGHLFISTGDGLDPQTSQDLDSYNGKLLRVNADGTIPADNPFVDGAGPNLDAIWALGLRNPFRFSFDPVTGTLLVADVGENDIEELNVGVPGANYGWPLCEGVCGLSGMTNPILTYSHDGRDASITGGFVYRGSQFPGGYDGSYFFADYAQQWIRRLTFDGNGDPQNVIAFEPSDGSSDNPDVGYPVDLKQGPDGALYYADVGLGRVVRIRYAAVNQPPVVVASATPQTGTPPLTVTFSSAGLSDPEGQPLTYSWTFGDGQVSSQPHPVHVYDQSGQYTARLTVSDGVNTSLAAPVSVAVGSAPTATILSPSNGSVFRAGTVLSFSGSASDPEDGTLPPSAYSWTIRFHHDTHFHPTLGPVSGTTSGTFAVPTSGHDWSGNTRYEINLTVSDSSGLQSTTSVFVFPEKVNLTFDTVPGGVTLEFDGISRTTPFVRDTLIGFAHTVNAPDQTQGGNAYVFASWSDGGPRSHTITTPPAASSYTATYQVTVGPPPDMAAAYSFDQGAGTTANDDSGNGKTGVLSGATWTTAGRFGNALNFDGLDDRVTSPAVALPPAFTLTAWVLKSSTSAYETIVAIGPDRDFYLGNGAIAFWNGTVEHTFGAAIPLNVWQHVAIVSDGATLRAYLNGAPQGSTYDVTLGAVLGGLQVGAWPTTGASVDFFAGSIDEVRVYARALTQLELQLVVSHAIGLGADTTPPVRSNGLPAGTLLAGTIQSTLSLTTDEIATCRYSSTAGTTYLQMIDQFGTTGGTTHSTVVSGLADGTAYALYVRCSDAGANANTTDFPITFAVAAAGSDTLLAAYGLNEGSGTSVRDSSGNGLDATVQGATWTTAGQFGNALSFDGLDDSVVGPTILLPTSFTYTAWIYNPSNVPYETIVTIGLTRNLILRSGRLRFWSGVEHTFGGPLLPHDVWHHVAIVSDGSLLQAYLNGAPYGQTVAVSLPSVTGELRIGSWHATRDFFGGRIDQVRVYDEALSQPDIQADMNTPVTN